MRLAAISDIHGNAPALEAVLGEAAAAEVDGIVVCGDVVGIETTTVLALLRAVAPRLWLVRGNADRDAQAVADDVLRDELATFQASVSLPVDGLGDVLFCHGTPASEDEIVTSRTPDDVVRRAASGVKERVIVGGHVHVQLDRQVDDVRWLNCGSVGRPYEGRHGAFWLVLGPDVDMRCTDYDVAAACARILATGHPEAEELVESLIEQHPASEAEEVFERLAAERGERG